MKDYGWRSLAFLPLLALSGCAVGSMKTVRGATYDLSGAETVLADGMEQQDPKGAGVEVRCIYWRSQRQSLNAPPQVLTNRAGVVGTTDFHALRNWAEQYAQMACGAAAEKRAEQKEARRKQAEAEAAQRAAEQKEAQAKAAAEALRASRAACGANNPYVAGPPDHRASRPQRRRAS